MGGGGGGHRYRSPVETLEAFAFYKSALMAQKACAKTGFSYAPHRKMGI